jgi:hypothetical protein
MPVDACYLKPAVGNQTSSRYIQSLARGVSGLGDGWGGCGTSHRGAAAAGG